MKIKVCGMKYPDNIRELSELPVDFMGMIFFSRSPRFVKNLSLEELDSFLSHYIDRVGVFVKEDIDFITEKVELYDLDLVQLHGDESPGLCGDLNKTIPVIKSFNVSTQKDFEQTKEYEGLCQYFLFDTRTPQHGGSGQKFDWDILDAYTGDTPFFLSGGISADDAEKIKSIKHPKLFGIDLNSKFETSPGLKDINRLQQFINTLNNEQD